MSKATTGRRNPTWLVATVMSVIVLSVAICAIVLFSGGGDEPGPAAETTTAPAEGTPGPVEPEEPEPTQAGVRAGAFCSPEGAAGVTAEGRRMVCVTEPGDDNARWRQAS